MTSQEPTIIGYLVTWSKEAPVPTKSLNICAYWLINGKQVENSLSIHHKTICNRKFLLSKKNQKSLFETRLNETYKILDVLIKHGRKGTNLHTWPSPKIWGPSVGLGVLTTGQVDYRLIWEKKAYCQLNHVSAQLVWANKNKGICYKSH
jgi:hypothetical protein